MKNWEDEFDERFRANLGIEGLTDNDVSIKHDVSTRDIKSFISDLLKKQREEYVERIKRDLPTKRMFDEFTGKFVTVLAYDDVIKAIEEETL